MRFYNMTMLNRTTRRLLFCLLIGVIGCARQGNLATVEGSERQNTQFQNGLDAERHGEWEKAITCYEALLEQNPKALSAHFQIAVILHDHTDRLVEAIYHYSRYLALRGNDSEKNKVATARRQNAEQLLTSRLLAASGVSTDADKAKLLRKNSELQTHIKQLEGQLKVSDSERSKLAQKLTALEKDNTRLRDLLTQVQSTPVQPAGPSASQVATSIQNKRNEAKNQRKQARLTEALDLIKQSETNPTDSEELPEVRPPEEEKSSKDNALRGVINPLREKEIPAAVNHPKTYVVKPGDTLFRLAEEFYGDKTMWRKIRDLNRAVIDPDGRLRTGQTLKLP